MRGAIPPLPSTPSWHGTQLKNQRDNYNFFTIVCVCVRARARAPGKSFGCPQDHEQAVTSSNSCKLKFESKITQFFYLC
jgi:hypothetical protein